MKCTFFGHKDAPDSVAEVLYMTISHLIEYNDVNCFYIGNHGQFDSMVKCCLQKLKKEYPHIVYYVVLAYLPTDDHKTCDLNDTLYPDGLENVPPRFAIIKRNEWMIDKADYVVTYVTHNFGGASKFKQLAYKKEKYVVEISSKIK